MRLFAYFRSSTSYRLRIALNLKNLAYEVVPVDLRTSEQKGEAFTRRNPFGSVPMLEAAGRDRAQSMALIEWLEEAYPQPPLLPAAIEDRYTARELAYAIATEIHAINNLPVLKYLQDPLGHSQDEIDTWYRHWLARTLDPVEARLAQLASGDFLFGKPGLFEVVLLPQVYNARKFAFDFSDKPHITRIEAACLALPAFQRAHPDNQPDSPEYRPSEGEPRP
ncbi:MAG: maleylacetoacetate isomerase [Erythrobacter sp.]|nr:maleylacetoacetate isomerase [Erythrobacter sp.]